MKFLTSTTDNGVGAVKVLCNLLEGRVLDLDIKHIHDKQLEGDPAVVDDVVFPADCAESDGVDVLVEEDCVRLC